MKFMIEAIFSHYINQQMNTLVNKEPNYHFIFINLDLLNSYSNDQSYMRVTKIGM